MYTPNSLIFNIFINTHLQTVAFVIPIDLPTYNSYI